jgi:cell division cycle protein 20 (cofactor of APC complex)
MQKPFFMIFAKVHFSWITVEINFHQDQKKRSMNCVQESPSTPRKSVYVVNESDLLGNSIRKSIQKSNAKDGRHRSNNNIQNHQYLCTFLETTSKKRVNEDVAHGTTKKQCLSSSKMQATVPNPSPSPKLQDRFIPNRAKVDDEFSYFALERQDNIENVGQEPILTPGQRKLKEQLNNLKSDSKKSQRRLIDCRKSLTPSFDRVENFTDQVRNCKDSISAKMTPKKTTRAFPSLPLKVLDAPDIMNDYYLNLLHWGQNNKLAVALGQTVYLWNGDDSTIETMTSLEEAGEEHANDYISSVQWSPNDAQYLAIGTSYHTIQIWDSKTKTKINEYQSHSNRVSSLAWHSPNVFSSGGKDSLIINHDLRMRRPIISYFTGHTQEICGLSWSPEGTILASGGNENMLCFWDMNFQTHNNNDNNNSTGGLSQQSYSPRLKLDQYHIAAVKALSWCPWQRNILASGGGTADRNIKIWNASYGTGSEALLKSVDTGSQVCSLQWSDHSKELVSSHGFSDYQLCIWKYQDMTKVSFETKRILINSLIFSFL